ncbi:MAG TPA: hypothetical protein VGN30_07905 [Steroidobacteraceae bacterium]|jgi:hypothetical protein
MNRFNCALAAAVAAVGIMATVPKAQAQVNIDFGAEPGCPYGYYDFAPYPCAPYGYYGPEWFNGGVFIGAGPWFHGGDHFRGHVDNRFDVHRGYGGPLPNRGDRPEPSKHLDQIDHFRGNEMRDGRGHAGGGRR